MASDFEARRAKHQETLLAFLGAELALGSTLVQSALLAVNENHNEHCEQAKRGAIAAADTVRRFINQVEDGKISAELAQRLLKLDRLLSTLTE